MPVKQRKRVLVSATKIDTCKNAPKDSSVKVDYLEGYERQVGKAAGLIYREARHCWWPLATGTI